MGHPTEPFVLPKQTVLAKCRQGLNTAWLVMHSPYLRHLKEGLQMGITVHQLWSRISVAFCVQPVYTAVLPNYLVTTCSCMTILPMLSKESSVCKKYCGRRVILKFIQISAPTTCLKSFTSLHSCMHSKNSHAIVVTKYNSTFVFAVIHNC